MKKKKQNKIIKNKTTKRKKLSNDRSWFINLLYDKTFQKILILFLISKILIFGFGTFAQIYYPYDRPVHVVDNWFLNGWAQYDGRAYLSIVTDGYNTEFNGSGNTAWFPLYPLLIKIIGMPFGIPDAYALIGFLLSNIFFVISMFYLFKLAEEEFDKKIALRAVAYILFFPTAYFFSAIYAESLFLFLSVAAFYYANKRQWAAAGIFGFFSALTRTFGILLFLPFLYIYLKDRKYRIDRIDSDILWIVLIPLGLIVYLSYLWLTLGNPFVFMQGHNLYGRHASWPWVPFATAIKLFISGLKSKNLLMLFYQPYNLFMAALFIFAIWATYKMRKTGYAIYMAFTLLLILISASFEGISREIIVVFPVFIALANIASDKRYCKWLTALFVVFGILLIIFTLRHLTAYLVPGLSTA